MDIGIDYWYHNKGMKMGGLSKCWLFLCDHTSCISLNLLLCGIKYKLHSLSTWQNTPSHTMGVCSLTMLEPSGHSYLTSLSCMSVYKYGGCILSKKFIVKCRLFSFMILLWVTQSMSTKLISFRVCIATA